jgi:formate hydrogenlyase subunit 4
MVDNGLSTSSGAHANRRRHSVSSYVLLGFFVATFFVPWSRAGTFGEVLSYLVPLTLAFTMLSIEHARARTNGAGSPT